MKTIFINGQVYTGKLPLCEAFVVTGNQFSYAGTTQEALREKQDGDEVIDLAGRFVCAGFNDSHMHLLNYGYALTMADLAPHTDALSSVQEEVRRFIDANKVPAGSWVQGRGWNQDYFSGEKRFPDRHDLDAISTEHPIVLTRACGHAIVVNSRALLEVGVTKDTPQPEGGRFELGADGEPNGVFRENAMDYVYSKLPEPTKEDIKHMILAASKALNSFGVTSSQSDDLLVFGNVPYQRILDAYDELVKEGRMTVRVYQQSQFTSTESLQGFFDKGYNTGVGNEWFKIGPLKMLGDGSLGARTAFMSVPYADDPTTSGLPIFTQQQFDDMVTLAHNHGMQIAIHAIGDGILDRILSSYEKALAENPRKDHRHGIVHCQITRPDQLAKFKELQLHAYIQSIFLDYDIHIVEERIGKERAASSYNFKTLYDTTHASNGSDCPVELPDAMKGIQCAVTRCSAKDGAGPYLPEQALTVEEALNSFTKEGAHASFEETIKGEIKTGMLADFVVLSENPFETAHESLKDIKVLRTYVGGSLRYQAV